MEIQERILLKGDEMFRRHGIRSITMDDIAKHLGVSKKTIYQHFPDKEELVVEVVKLNITRHMDQMDQCCGVAAKDAIDELLQVNNQVSRMIQSYNPIMFYDLQKYHPNAWIKFRQFRNQEILAKIKDNILRGMSEGLYRKDIDIDIISKMRLEQVDMSFNYDVFPSTEYRYDKVMIELTEHFLYGLLSLKGHKLINQYKNIKEDN